MKKKLFILSSVFICALIYLSAFKSSTQPIATVNVFNDYTACFDKLEASLDTLLEACQKNDTLSVKAAYFAARSHFKSIEFLLEYQHPTVVKRYINGAPLPTLIPHTPDLSIQQPQGFQVLDELISAQALELLQIKEVTKKLRTRLHALRMHEPPTDREVFEAARTELIRVETLGLTHFDTPGSKNGLIDSKNTIQFLTKTFEHYQSYQMTSADKRLLDEMTHVLSSFPQWLESSPVDDLDYYHAITHYLHPIYSQLLKLQLSLNIETIADVNPAKQPTSYEANHLYATNFLNSSYFLNESPNTDYSHREELGKLLFFDPILSANNERSCASCHIPEKGFSDGLPKSKAFQHEGTVMRNAPGLINAIFAERYFFDLRALKIEDQIEHVVLSHREFNTTFQDLISKLSQSEEYKAQFIKSFPNVQESNIITKNTISAALASYMKTLVGFNSKFDQNVRGTATNLTAQEKHGFNLFMGKGQCGTCHFAPNFSGLAPPFYKESEAEVLGVPRTADLNNATLDPDLGRYNSGKVREQADFHRHSFKTVSIRNAAATAPYMHNGVFNSLKEVVDFYDAGGGLGIGLDIPNQTLPGDSLHLTESEKNDIISFIESLTDSTLFHQPDINLPVIPSLPNRTIGGIY